MHSIAQVAEQLIAAAFCLYKNSFAVSVQMNVETVCRMSCSGTGTSHSPQN